MNNRVGLGVFGTFGEPYGFQQLFYHDVNFSGSLDLDDTAIEFYPGAKLLSVKRELVDGVYTICFCMYSYVRELNTERFGTFLGTCIVLQDGYAEADYIYQALRALHDYVMENTGNVENSILVAPEAKDVVLKEPEEFIALKANVIPISKTPFFSSTVLAHKQHLITPNPLSEDSKDAQLVNFFEKALKEYTDTAALYFSFDRNVYDFVTKAAILDIIDWDEFIEHKSAIPEKAVVRTKKGIQRIHHTIPENNMAAITPSQPDNKNENTTGHTDPDVTDTSSYNNTGTDDDDDYDPYKPFDLWEDPVPEKGWGKAEAEQRIKEYNRLFKYTNTLLLHINEPDGKRQAKKQQRKKNREQHQNVTIAVDETIGERKKKRPVALFVLIGILLLGCVAFFLKRARDNDNSAPVQTAAAVETSPASVQDSMLVEDDTTKTPLSNEAPATTAEAAPSQPAGSVPPMQPVAKVPAPGPEPARPSPAVARDEAAMPKNRLMPNEPPAYAKAKELHPRPNMEMTQNDIVMLKQNGVKNKTIAELTRLLFDNVPSNIGNIYRGQELEYGASLLNSNKTAFQKSGSDYICVSDVIILHIPAYKSPRLPAVFPK